MIKSVVVHLEKFSMLLKDQNVHDNSIHVNDLK
jgi:hypothetical protein